MVFSPEDEELYTWLKSSIPSWFFTKVGITDEQWRAVVAALGRSRDLVDSWVNRTFLLYSEGIWLDQHAKDFGSARQYNESDVGVAARLRTPLNAVTYEGIVDGITAVLSSYGLTWTPNLIELRKGGPFWLERTSPSGTGDTLTVKIINIDDQGRIKLSRKALLKEQKKNKKREEDDDNDQ